MGKAKRSNNLEMLKTNYAIRINEIKSPTLFTGFSGQRWGNVMNWMVYIKKETNSL